MILSINLYLGSELKLLLEAVTLHKIQSPFTDTTRGRVLLKIIVLIPLILSLLWFGYLRVNSYSLAQGKQGFTYILVLSSVIAVFYALMLFLTH
ncbi:MAG: hypothetical protein ACJARF_001405 [Alteromonadaceae bacterium]|jgi:hypothetical protein